MVYDDQPDQCKPEQYLSQVIKLSRGRVPAIDMLSA